MNVTVRAFADFRELLGKELVLSIPEGANVEELLHLLGNGSAAFLSKVFESNGQLKPSIIILQNGMNIHSLNEFETKLAEGDVIAIFPLIAGG